MLAFILSKMNLLLMVTAIFALMAYFTFFVSQSVVLREAQELLGRFSEDTYGVLTSSGQCHQTIVPIPRYIYAIGSGERRNQLRFLLHISKIETSILAVLEQTPPELYADIVNRGIYLAGGGALLRGLSKRFTDKINIAFHLAEDPLQAIARGTGIALKNADKFSFLMR